MFSRKPTEVMIMPAEDADLLSISEIHAASFARGWSTVELHKMFIQTTMTFLVAKEVGKPSAPILGFNIFRQTSEEAEIISVAVDPARRTRQVGLALMRDAIHRLMSDRVPALLLEVEETNDAAISLYRKLGFTTLSSRPGYYEQSATQDEAGSREKTAALVMRLTLE